VFLAFCLTAALLPAFALPVKSLWDGGGAVQAPTARAAALGYVNPFGDVAESDWFYNDVIFVSARGLMTGTGPNTFSPEGTMTRAMFVTVLYRMSGATGSAAIGFSDVPVDAWYGPAVAWAYTNGIVNGIGNARFAPDDAVTREQLAVILFRYAQYAGRDVSVGEDTNILSYTDAFTVTEYAYPALQWTCGSGIMTGDDKGRLNPQGLATRAEAAKIISAFVQSAAG
jgi:hypothetical protein